MCLLHCVVGVFVLIFSIGRVLLASLVQVVSL